MPSIFQSNNPQAPKTLARLLDSYDYSLPTNLIAQTPAFPRDRARLLVYKKGAHAVYDHFLNLPHYLPKGAVLVFNETKVIPARLYAQKETGGKVELLYIEMSAPYVKVLANTHLAAHSMLTVTRGITFKVHSHKNNYYLLKPSFPLSALPRVLDTYGATPLPPYMKHSPLSETARRRAYQSIFAKKRGAVAAPTASLHFTPRLLRKLKRAQHEIRFVTLHVGLGTFAPLTEVNIARGRLHKEYYEISKTDAAALNAAKKSGHPIIAVGTTVVRTLESATNAHGQLTKLRGTTDLFIRPGYKFKFINGMITNFHVPRSSLLMLVSAFAGRRTIRTLYKKAIKKRFRFFSFGDGMLLY